MTTYDLINLIQSHHVSGTDWDVLVRLPDGTLVPVDGLTMYVEGRPGVVGTCTYSTRQEGEAAHLVVADPTTAGLLAGLYTTTTPSPLGTI